MDTQGHDSRNNYLIPLIYAYIMREDNTYIRCLRYFLWFCPPETMISFVFSKTKINSLISWFTFQISLEGECYHKSCFRCAHGGCPLTHSSYAALDGVLYCRHHFAQLFMEKGNYHHVLQAAAHKKNGATPPPEPADLEPKPESEGNTQEQSLWMVPPYLSGFFPKKKKKEGCRPSHVEIHVKLVYKLFSVCKLIWEVIDILKTKKAWSNVFFFFQLILLEILCDGINNVL